MGILNTIKGWFDMLLTGRAKEEFDLTSITSGAMEQAITNWTNIYCGKPEWADEDVQTVNFAKSICSEIARLTTLAIKIKIDGSARAEWLQKQIDNIYFNLRGWVEYAAAFGTVILKPNGESVDVVFPDRFIITNTDGEEITGIVFFDEEYSAAKKKYYTRLEYHRFEDDGTYVITNRCRVGDTESDKGKPIDIAETPWAHLSDEVAIAGIERPLFGVLKMPYANNIDAKSPLGLSAFASAIEELRDLDIAYSRNATEIFDSKRTVLLDSDRLMPSGTKVRNSVLGFENSRKQMKLPDYVKAVYGNGVDDVYHEINPTLQTDMRLTGINALLSQIGYKSGFSNGYFVFNESTGIQTATQIEADQQRTIQLIKDDRDKLEICLNGVIYALDKFADLYDFAPVGAYEVVYDFGDITYNREEDRARWYGYAISGKVPFWYYLVKFEGLSEEEAKALEGAAKPKNTLFMTEE